MRSTLPQPREVGIHPPANVLRDRYEAGFEHALQGGQLHQVEFLRRSFRMGYRAAKLYLKELRRKQGIIEFPAQGRVRIRCR